MGLQGHAVLCPLMEHIRLKKNDETLQVFEWQAHINYLK